MSNRQAMAERLRRVTVEDDADAPVSLANMYFERKEVPHSCYVALNLPESAAAIRNVKARSRLAVLYATGDCVQCHRL